MALLFFAMPRNSGARPNPGCPHIARCHSRCVEQWVVDQRNLVYTIAINRLFRW